MLVHVTPTHDHGRPVARHELDTRPPRAGVLSVALVPNDGLRRAARMASLRRTDSSNGAPLLPDLYDVELIALGDRAMMLCGFEEVGERRYYQSWWIRWD